MDLFGISRYNWQSPRIYVIMTFMFKGIFTVIEILILAPLFCSGLFSRKDSSIAERYICGFIAVWALFELVSVPFILMSAPFSLMCTVYEILLTIVMFAGVIRYTVRKKKNKDDPDLKILTFSDKKTILLWIPVLALLLGQCVFFVIFQHYDGDDSYYVAQSTITLETDTMFRHDTNNGHIIDVEGRHALGALPMWIAWLSKMADLHPAITAHTILAPFFLCLMYGAYSILSERIISKEKWRPVFVLLMLLWYFHSNVSLYTAETFAYTRTWQGKAVFSNIIIPLAFCMIYDIYKNKKNTLLIACLLSLCGIMSTSTAAYLLTIVFGCAGLVLGISAYIKTKKLKNALLTLLPFIIASLPLLAGGVIYIIIK